MTPRGGTPAQEQARDDAAAPPEPLVVWRTGSDAARVKRLLRLLFPPPEPEHQNDDDPEPEER